MLNRLGLYSSTISHFSASPSSSSWPLNFRPNCFPCPKTLHQSMISSSSSSSSSALPYSESSRTCFSQQEDDHGGSSELVSSVPGGVAALGKFDALHIGHRELAIQASKAGNPLLLSFVGMAEVLGWEPRPPIVAQCDRKRVLSSWASYCGGVSPSEFQIEFSSVRHLSPREFVEKLSKDLRVTGVVAGENYRFGYKAAGDAAELVKLCEEYGMKAYIINSVMDSNRGSININSTGNNNNNNNSDKNKDRGQVSSTRVRRALAVGDIKYVSQLLGRSHRLVVQEKSRKRFARNKHKISASKACLMNLAPKEGLYENCSLFFGDQVVTCRVVIDTASVHVEIGDVDSSAVFGSAEFKVLSIEFDST